MTPLAKIVEALLFLSPELVSLDDLRDATQQDEWAVLDALTELRDGLHGRGVVLKEIGGGWTLASHPGAEALLYRAAPLPDELRRLSLEQAEASYEPAVLGAALGGLLRTPPPVDLSHMAMPRVTLGERVAHLRELLRRGTFAFDDAVEGADRVTVAVTVFALLELYKRGEASWEQAEPFGPITVQAS
jgi:hypothetical protein